MAWPGLALFAHCTGIKNRCCLLPVLAFRIPEYWIVNLPDVGLEVYRAPDRERGVFTETEVLSLGDTVTAPFDAMQIPVSERMFASDGAQD